MSLPSELDQKFVEVTAADLPLHCPLPSQKLWNTHPRVFRSALVGIGERLNQTPVMIIEPKPGQFPGTTDDRAQFECELRELGAGYATTRTIGHFLFRRDLPVDVRHNVKINREQLAIWAAKNRRARLP